MIQYVGLVLITILAFSCISYTFFKGEQSTSAQKQIQTMKYRNLVIDLGNGLKTNAQLTYPVVQGRYPGVLLIAGSSALDKNETFGFVHNNGPKPPAPFWQIAEFLTERGYAVLRYDKRGVGANFTILDKNAWGNLTVKI